MWARLIFCSLVMATSVSYANEMAEDLGAAVGGVAGATYGGNVGGAAGAVMGKYAARSLNNGVGKMIDQHFDRQNQNFANRTGMTIHTGGKVFRPKSASKNK